MNEQKNKHERYLVYLYQTNKNSDVILTKVTFTLKYLL